MLSSHKLSSSSSMVPFQTSITSNPINKIILLTSIHNAHIVINVSNVYVKVLNTFGRCQITLVLSLSTCFFPLLLFFFFSAFYFYFFYLVFFPYRSFLFFLFLFFLLFLFLCSSLILLSFCGHAIDEIPTRTAEVVTFIHLVHVQGDKMVFVRE